MPGNPRAACRHVIHRVRSREQEVFQRHVQKTHPGGHGNNGKEAIERGEDPQSTAGIKQAKRDVARAGLLLNEERCDQKAGNDEEDVHAKRAMFGHKAWNPWGESTITLCVREDYKSDRNGSHAIDRRYGSRADLSTWVLPFRIAV